MPEVARVGRACIRDYGGAGAPVLFVPSLINPPTILDLTAEQSLLRWLAGRGVRPLLVDWGTPAPHEPHDIAGHVEALLLPLIAALGTPLHLAGYCLGGTMALAAAVHARPLSLTLIAAPWRFAGYDDGARAAISALWDAAHPACAALGLVPVEVLQTGFWRLDPVRTVAKYARFAAMLPDSAAARAFIALEDWANGGAPLTFAAGRELFDDFYAADLPGSGRWRVGGMAVTPDAITCPMTEFVSQTDRIVPPGAAAGLAGARRIDLGHVGMIVGGRARAMLWEPLADWLSQVRQS
jgi:polyhydroxyalkanoate synthase